MVKAHGESCGGPLYSKSFPCDFDTVVVLIMDLAHYTGIYCTSKVVRKEP